MIRLVAVLAAFLLAACGGGETVSAPRPSPTVTEEPAAAPSEKPTVEPTVEPTDEPALPTGACGAAFARAAAVDEMQDTVQDLHPAVRACTSVEDWRAAAEKHPAATDSDPDLFLTNVCQYSPEVADADLCAEVTD